MSTIINNKRLTKLTKKGLKSLDLLLLLLHILYSDCIALVPGLCM